MTCLRLRAVRVDRGEEVGGLVDHPSRRPLPDSDLSDHPGRGLHGGQSGGEDCAVGVRRRRTPGSARTARRCREGRLSSSFTSNWMFSAVKNSPLKERFSPAQKAFTIWTYSVILRSGLVSETGKILKPIFGTVGKLPRPSPMIALPPESSLSEANVAAAVTGMPREGVDDARTYLDASRREKDRGEVGDDVPLEEALVEPDRLVPERLGLLPKTTASFTVSTGLKPSARRETMVVAWLSSAFKTISRGL